MRIKSIKIMLLVSLLALTLFLAGCAVKPQIKLDTQSFDLGDINPDNGVRVENFTLRNTGNAVLNITSVSTSCGCTTAKVDNKTIAPGEETILEVSYDPSAHPGLTGEITRVVYIKSNDPSNEEIELEIRGNMLPSNSSSKNSSESDAEAVHNGLTHNEEKIKESKKASNDAIDAVVGISQDETYDTATYAEAQIYFNKACTMCAEYLNEELIPSLKELGVKSIIKKDYVNQKKYRLELNQRVKSLGIPPELQAHFMIFLDNKTVLGGHVPKHIIKELFNNPFNDSLLVFQDEMEGAVSYQVWAFRGKPKTYDITAPITEYTSWYEQNKNSLSKTDKNQSWNPAIMLPLVISTGFLDGINPCAIAVLLLFIAFLYALRKTKATVWKMGLTYILAVFLAYILIGIGLLKAFIFSGYPHLLAVISAYLIIALGLLTLYQYLFPKTKLKLGIPAFSKRYIREWMHKATLPASFIAGFLVGLCTFPCSGGIYVAIIGLLSTSATAFQGYAYLILYNIFFVVPLIILLIAASNKRMTNKLDKWEHSESRTIKLISAIIMLLLGLIMLLWFI